VTTRTPPASAATTNTVAESSEIRELAARYGEAWNSQDLDAIMDLHTDDTVFVAHAAGSEPAVGKEAVREAFAGYLALLPDIDFAERALHTGEGHWVLESLMSGTVAQPIEVEGLDPEAKFVASENVRSGARVEVDCVDVIEVRDGLVASKQTYIDSLAMQRQLGGE
jgi:steroid delta-isomerase-like uncharacterized protein